MDEPIDAEPWRGRAGLLAVQERIERWAARRPDVRALALFGSLTRSDRPGDDWSDVDAVLVVEDPAGWRDGAGAPWLSEIGPVWLHFLHPAPVPGLVVHQVLFAGGYDADLIVVSEAELRAVLAEPEIVAEVFGHGFRVAFDRAGAFAALRVEPAAGDPDLPDAEALRFTIQTSLYQLVWATKRLRRGEHWRAADDVNGYLKGHLLRLLEWEARATGRGRVFPDGRQLERWADPDVVAGLAASYASTDPASIAAAIRAHLALVERVAAAAAAELGLAGLPAATPAVRAWIEARLGEADHESMSYQARLKSRRRRSRSRI